MMIKRIIYILLLVLIMISCKQKQTWDISRTENTVLSYENYLKQFPNGKFADSAKFYIEELIWLKASADTLEVILSSKAAGGKMSVVPYGREKLITIFNPRILDDNKIEVSYKMEKEAEKKLILISAFSEANIAALTSSYYYKGISYTMSEKKITFSLRVQDWVKGRAKVNLYFVSTEDVDSDNKCLAASNVLTLYLIF